MSSQVYVVKRCDHPQCEYAPEIPEGESQEVSPVEFWVNAPGGRKTKPIKVEMCGSCLEELKELFQMMQRVDQNKDS